MTRTLTRLAAILAALVAAAVATAAAPGTPDVSQMPLRAADFKGAKVMSQGAQKSEGYEAGYQRWLQFRTPYGRSKLVFVQSAVILGTADQVASDFGSVSQLLRTKSGRSSFADVVVAAAGKSVTRKDVTFGRLRTPNVGDAALELPVTLRVKKVRVYESILFIQVDRALATLVVGGARTVVPGETATLASLVVAHIGEGLVPLPVTAPTIGGTALQGQTLTVTAGSWGNTPQLSYQWQSCDAAGACADIAGATGQTYVVGAADAGKTLRVVETATNRFGNATAPSTATTAVASG